MTASPVLFSRNNCVETEAPTPNFLLWIFSGITLHHPPILQEKRRGQPPRQYRQRKQTPFVPPAPSQRRPRYMIHPSSLLQPS
ncbi:hypothetical protein CgunFtcFv8_012867 [Champsocephalus gunnari]|uniref:Uncharacterized protein n=1 Tax=Champsocephalus gunnari TaxID=52237 RepID=A0AAN8HTG0_CHAGU|nr:hypothetical protein CgunFtcFv8_012867 [Champsocephalus gunnari]